MTDGPDFLRQFLTERDMPCPACGYNLRNLLSPRCPECGEELRLAVGLVEPRQAAVITGLTALASGLGFNGLLLVYVGMMALRMGRFPPQEMHIILILGAGLVVFAGLLAIWVSKWRRIRRASPGARWLLAAACWAVAFAWAVLFGFLIR